MPSRSVIESRMKEERWPLPSLLQPQDCALIIIDVQDDFCAPDGYFARHGFDLGEPRSILSPLQLVLAEARRLSVLTVYVQYTQLPDGSTLSEAHKRGLYHDPREPQYCVLHTPGHDVAPEIEPQASDVAIHKFRASAFHQTGLDIVLRANGVRTCIFTGLVTEGCVEASARAAVMHDYFGIVLTDAVASFSPQLHQAALTLMSATMDCIPSAALIEIWNNHQEGDSAPGRNR